MNMRIPGKPLFEQLLCGTTLVHYFMEIHLDAKNGSNILIFSSFEKK